MEAKAGVPGFTDAATTLQEVSEAKSSVDAEKGEALEEISGLIANIHAQIKERKTWLAPRIKELRTVRGEFQELEQEHTQRKVRYDEESAVHETARAKIATDVVQARREVGRDESRYHYLGAMMSVLDSDVRRLGEEKQRIRSGGDNSIASIEVLKKELRIREDASKRVRDQFTKAKASEGSAGGQRDMIGALVRLVQAKLELYQGRSVGSGAHAGGGGGGMGDTMGGFSQGDEAFLLGESTGVGERLEL